jgi:3-hydroxymyristoyl/3-hydroxydecanoyl-(acyl carrier protein) dehydratase
MIDCSVPMIVRIGADHPSLPGHFPGRPIVPGVVIIEQVLITVGLVAGDLQRIEWVKFARPLLPDEEAILEAVRDGDSLRFTLRREGQTLASGLLRLSRERSSGAIS